MIPAVSQTPEEPAVAAPEPAAAEVLPDAPARRRRKWTPSELSVVSILIYMGILTTEGFLRWVLSKVGLEPLLYLREIFPLLAMLFAATMRGLPVRTAVFFLLCVQLAFSGLVGHHFGGSLGQVAFGTKIFFPVLTGVVVYPAIVRNWDLFLRGCTILLVIAVGGVLINSHFQFPWIGADFTVGNVTMELSREWTELDGRDRLPGFSRSSFDAATHIVIFTAFALFRTRKNFLRLLIAAAGVYATYLTTSKAALGCLLQLLANFALLETLQVIRNPPPFSMWHRARVAGLFLLRAQILIFAIATVVLPLNTSGTLSVVERDLRQDSQFHLLSVQDRAENFWPLAMDHIRRNGSVLLGVGVGGLGAPLDLFGNVEIPITCDNAFLYAYGVFGLFFLPYFLSFLWMCCTSRIVSFRAPTIIGLIALSACLQGLTKSTFEGIYDCLFIGIIIAHGTYGWRMKDSPIGNFPPSAETPPTPVAGETRANAAA